MESLLKLNLGCGEHHREGYINVDKYSSPDILHDLETFPWPWKESSVKEILLYHVLEHLGQNTDIFLGIIKELYRISAPEAEKQGSISMFHIPGTIITLVTLPTYE